MSTEQNRQLLQHIHAQLAQGDSRPLVESLADEVSWTVMGSSSWSGTYRGKQAVLGELLAPLGRRFAGQYRSTAQSFIAEGDCVVVEARGEVITKAGLPYRNRYCFIYRLAEGQVRELTEYCDTALLDTVLGQRDQTPA